MTKTDLTYYVPQVEAIISGLSLTEKMLLLHQDLNHMTPACHEAADTINTEIIVPNELHLDAINQLFSEVLKGVVRAWKAEQEYESYRPEVTE